MAIVRIKCAVGRVYAENLSIDEVEVTRTCLSYLNNASGGLNYFFTIKFYGIDKYLNIEKFSTTCMEGSAYKSSQEADRCARRLGYFVQYGTDKGNVIVKAPKSAFASLFSSVDDVLMKLSR